MREQRRPTRPEPATEPVPAEDYFTPGPWHRMMDYVRAGPRDRADSIELGRTWPIPDQHYAVAYANAQLMSAAPTMLAVLRAALVAHENGISLPWDAMRAVVHQATDIEMPDDFYGLELAVGSRAVAATGPKAANNTTLWKEETT